MSETEDIIERTFSDKFVTVISQKISELEAVERQSIILLAVVISYRGWTGLAGCDINVKFNTPENISQISFDKGKQVTSEYRWNPAYFINTSFRKEWINDVEKLADHWDSLRTSDGNEDSEEVEDESQIKKIWGIVTSTLSTFKQSKEFKEFKELLPSCTHILITNGTGQGAEATATINGTMPDEFWEGSLFYPGE